MDGLCKCMFSIIETIVNSIKTRHVSKVSRHVSPEDTSSGGAAEFSRL